jgi:ubiquinone/menaquinone biosynthesis C-methylase UbiE
MRAARPYGALIMRRVETEEWLDRDDISLADRARSLRDLQRFNRFAGGYRAYRLLIHRLIGRARRFSLLDLGTGSSDLLRSVEGKGSRIGLDFKIQHLALSRGGPSGPQIRRVAGDAFRLPFRSSSIDVIASSHLFHHFTAEQNIEILSEALRVARVGVVITDTRRHVVPLVFVIILAATRLVSRVTRNDAPASIRRGYTRAEVQAIASGVAAEQFEVVSVFPYRFGLLLWK